MLIMLKQDGQLFKIKTWVDGINFLIIKPGILRKTFIPWMKFFKKDFHPWESNNLDLIEYWKKRVPQRNTL
jgi:hypothetical protein